MVRASLVNVHGANGRVVSNTRSRPVLHAAEGEDDAIAEPHILGCIGKLWVSELDQ